MKTTMKNLSATLCLIMALTFGTKAQVAGGEYMELFDLYIMGEYDEVLDEAIKLTEKDKTRREQEPYLYVAMVYMKRYQDPDYTAEDKDDVLKDALKYAYKFTKYDRKDEERDLISQNRETLNTLQRLTVEMADFFYVEEDYRKAAYFLKKYHKVEETPKLQLAMASCMMLSRNMAEGTRFMEGALKTLNTMDKVQDEEQTQLDEMTRKSFSEAMKFLIANEDMEEAKMFLEMGLDYFEDNEMIKELYAANF